jgi:hypothetical protein
MHPLSYFPHGGKAKRQTPSPLGEGWDGGKYIKGDGGKYLKRRMKNNPITY